MLRLEYNRATSNNNNCKLLVFLFVINVSFAIKETHQIVFTTSLVTVYDSSDRQYQHCMYLYHRAYIKYQAHLMNVYAILRITLNKQIKKNSSPHKHTQRTHAHTHTQAHTHRPTY